MLIEFPLTPIGQSFKKMTGKTFQNTLVHTILLQKVVFLIIA